MFSKKMGAVIYKKMGVTNFNEAIRKCAFRIGGVHVSVCNPLPKGLQSRISRGRWALLVFGPSTIGTLHVRLRPTCDGKDCLSTLWHIIQKD